MSREKVQARARARETKRMPRGRRESDDDPDYKGPGGSAGPRRSGTSAATQHSRSRAKLWQRAIQGCVAVAAALTIHCAGLSMHIAFATAATAAVSAKVAADVLAEEVRETASLYQKKTERGVSEARETRCSSKKTFLKRPFPQWHDEAPSQQPSRACRNASADWNTRAAASG